MILSPEISEQIVQEKLGIDTRKATPAQLYYKEETFAIFKSFLTKKPTEDVYFIPYYSYTPKEDGIHYILTMEKLQIYMIPRDTVLNWENLKLKDNDTRAWFNLSDAKLVWHEDDGSHSGNTTTPENTKEILESLKDKQGDDLLHDRLTMRDYACIHLRVPESGKPWLNKLIEKSLKTI